MKKLQNKYDILLIIIIILSLFSSILLLVTETTAQYSGWMFYLTIFATVLSFIPLALTLILKSDKKYFAITATYRLESNITCIMCSTCWQQLDICITACPNNRYLDTLLYIFRGEYIKTKEK